MKLHRSGPKYMSISTRETILKFVIDCDDYYDLSRLYFLTLRICFVLFSIDYYSIIRFIVIGRSIND